MEYNRVKWASRRGMLELDLLLGPFVESRYPALPEDDQRRFQLLLRAEDQDLYQYLMGHVTPTDEDLAAAVHLVRHFACHPDAH